MNDMFKIKLNSYDNVDRYLQFLTFSELDNMSFQSHYHFLKRYNIRFEKNVNFKIVYKMHLYNKTNYFYYIIDNIVNIYNHYDIFIRVNDFIFHVSYRYERDYLSDLQFKNIFQKIHTIIKRHFTF